MLAMIQGVFQRMCSQEMNFMPNLMNVVYLKLNYIWRNQLLESRILMIGIKIKLNKSNLVMTNINESGKNS